MRVEINSFGDITRINPIDKKCFKIDPFHVLQRNVVWLPSRMEFFDVVLTDIYSLDLHRKEAFSPIVGVAFKGLNIR